ncbi:MAG TPA: vitamin B12-dependent ribonucleotide reductase [Fibrobacteraceae bacterium]|nr:vitamin B12-dependent ribonucleotide reductase [Fibrobacteraceae bacterium]
MTTKTSQATLLPLKLTENSTRVLKARYLRKNDKGETLEKPEDLFMRVAKAIAEVEIEYGKTVSDVEEATHLFYNLMVDGQFMPNSPTLMNAGREMGMLSACFVLPLEDSIDDIFSTVKATAMIQKAGGGTGFSFDKLRPTGDYIKSSGGTTSGPISFWKVLSETTNAIQQGAFRRGANMGMMSITHPDIVTFIYAKQDLKAFTNFNISIKVPNAWMEAYRADPDGAHLVFNRRNGLQFVLPRSIEPGNYDISKLLTQEAYEAMPAETRPQVWTRREIFSVIIDCAWTTGEPGLIFIDNINKANPTPHIGEIEATNPCGEQPLLPYEACNLGSINVARFVRQVKEKADYDWDGLREAITASTRFLDNVIEANRYPLPEIEKMCKGNRKIGLGVMGFADAMFRLGIAYDSDEGIAFGEKVMKFINDESHNASEALANERGVFPNWKGSVWDTKYNRPMRNSACTTVAPTGTISIIANCSGGIEPLFSLAFIRQVLDGQKMVEINPYFEEVAKSRGIHSQELFQRLAEEGSLAHLEGVPEDLKHIFVCSHDIDPEWHVRMQAAFQRHCDSSISKTINLPNQADRAEVEKIYTMAWDLNCKGITVYRDGCRSMQPMTLKKKEEPASAEPVAVATKRTPDLFKARRPIKTQNILSGIRIRQATPFGHMHVTITVDPQYQRELEIFAQLGKAGDVAASDLEAISRLTSLFLRIGGSIHDVVDQLEGIGSHMSVPTRDGRVMSLADALGKTLHRYQIAKDLYGIEAILLGQVDFSQVSLKDDHHASASSTTAMTSDALQNMYKVKCPECGGVLSFSEGCIKCNSCGYSKC